MTVILVRTVVFFIILSISLRLMGKRQIGEIQLTEFVSAVMLSELAVLPIADTDIPFIHGIIGVAALACMEIIGAFLSRKSPSLRRVMEGESLVLVSNGRVLEKNLTRSRISTDELFAAIRSNGLSGMEAVGYVILEQTGALSVIPADQGGVSHVVVVDGKLRKRALADSGRDMKWLNKQLSLAGLEVKSLLYLTVDDGGKIKYAFKSGN